jgi:chaperonin cofactor prefoldin
VETRLAADEQERELLSVEIETLLKQIESLEERCARLAGLDGSAGEE